MPYKCVEPLGTKLPLELANAFRRRANAAGCTPSDLLRDLICHLEHGLLFHEMESNDRRKALGLQLLHEVPHGFQKDY